MIDLRSIWKLVIVAFILWEAAPVLGDERVIDKIQVMGNEKIESVAILELAQTKVGDPLSVASLRQDLERIYEMGYFTDVQVDVKEVEEGVLVTFVVVEKPSIGQIVISGNENIETDKIQEEIDVSLHSIVKTDKIQGIIEDINKLYLSKGYYGAEVSYRMEPLERNEVLLEIMIDEGRKAWIRKIVFTGNEHISSRTLRGRMATKRRSLLSIITKKGYLDEDMLSNDIDVLRAFYYSEGYLRATVEKPKTIVGEGGRSIVIEIAIDEGPQYTTESIHFTGDILTNEADLLEVVKTREGDVYRSTVGQEDVLKLTDVYADQGYANAEVQPIIRLDDENHGVDLTFDIDKGEKVHFERIRISGNTKTRDRVIRRELRFGEGDLFSSTGLRRSWQRLRTTGYFKEVDIATSEGASDEKLNLDIEVEEAPTGSVSVGAGFSTKDQFVTEAAITERNLFGLGYKVNFSGALGGETQALRASFTDPWVLGYPVEAGIEGYATEDTFFSAYSTKVRGGRLRLGKELGEYLRGRITYTYERTEVFDVDATASRFVQEQEGERDSSILGLFLTMDTRDDFFFPTEGGTYRVGTEVSGGPLGGDVDFYRFTGEFQYYYPLFWKLIGHGRLLLGSVAAYGDLDEVPIWERFYVGGGQTIRGFDYGEAGPEDETGEIIGSEKQWVGSFEILFPLSKEMGLRGVVFFDVGKGFDDFDDVTPVRYSVGLGLRWLTPLGPLKMDYGFNLNPEDNEEDARFHFFIGAPF